MGTTAKKLKRLLDNKRAIRDAITEKTGEDAGEVMSTYAEKIMAIEGGGTKYFRTTILLDQTITDPATMITKVYDDGGIDMIRANSHRYVCKLVNGVLEAKQLQDNNGTLYLDGTTADLTGGEGDVFMKLPEFFYRATEQEADKWFIDFVYGERPSEGYKFWEGNDFIGVYESYVENQNLYSVSSSSPTGGITQSMFVEYARNRGNGYSIISWSHHCMMAFLFFAYYLHTNSQLMCGDGAGGLNGENDLLGMEDTKTGHKSQVNFWGLEGWWGKRYEWIGNVSSNANRWDITDNDGSIRTVKGLGGAGFSIKMLIGANLDAISLDAGGSSTTGYCDRCIYSSTNANDIVVARGTADINNAGVVCYDADMSKGQIVSISATRLCYRGYYKIIE